MHGVVHWARVIAMTENYIKAVARSLKAQVYRERRVVWEWKRWKNWSRTEIETLAELAGVCFACDGEYEPVRFFEWA